MYLEAGAGRDGALLLIHGNFASPRWWNRTLSLLTPEQHVVAPRLRGFSRHDARDVETIHTMALDVAAIIEALRLTRVTVVGHSLGGAVALELAALRLPSVSELVLVTPAPGDHLQSLKLRDTTMGRTARMIDPESLTARAVLEGLLRISQTLGTGRRQLHDGLLQMMPHAEMGNEELELLVDDACEVPAGTIVQLYRALHAWRAEPAASRVLMPTRVLSCADDVLAPATAVAALANLIPHAELTHWSDCGHSPMIEHPQRFVDWLLKRERLSPRVSVAGV